MSAQEQEQAAARTTIVGSESAGSNRLAATIPRGIEVLVKKAAVDPEFRELLFEQRGAAAAAIELELDPAENSMLNALPQEQLAQIVSQTIVPVEQRRVFLGRLAVAMLAVLGAGLEGCATTISAGVRPLPPPPQPMPVPPMGIRPDLPPPNSLSTNNPPPPPTRGIQPDHP